MLRKNVILWRRGGATEQCEPCPKGRGEWSEVCPDEAVVAFDSMLAAMRFLENGENVVFLDPPGVGKTHLASALGLVASKHRLSTYYINCHQLIEQPKKAYFENRLPDKLRVLAKYRMLIIDELGYLPMDIQGANLFFR